MIHLVTAQNRSLYTRELESLHRARNQVFVNELGWKLPVSDGLEYDEYDDERAMYVLGFDAQEDVVMSVRFRPADDRTMLTDHFSHVLPADVRPFDDGKTWEVSRGFSRERGLRRQHLMRKAACMLAPMEIALAAGVNRYVGFTDVRMLNFYSYIGWKLNLLGSAVPYPEGDGVAYEAEVSSRVIADIRQTWGLPAPAYTYIETLAEGLNVHDMAERLAQQDPARRQLMPPIARGAHRAGDADAHYSGYR